jgi:hypothetical protein
MKRFLFSCEAAAVEDSSSETTECKSMGGLDLSWFLSCRTVGVLLDRAWHIQAIHTGSKAATDFMLDEIKAPGR